MVKSAFFCFEITQIIKFQKKALLKTYDIGDFKNVVCGILTAKLTLIMTVID